MVNSFKPCQANPAVATAAEVPAEPLAQGDEAEVEPPAKRAKTAAKPASKKAAAKAKGAMKRPAAAAAAVGGDPPADPPQPAAAASEKPKYRESTIRQQSQLGCSKCVGSAKGCTRCREIHELWKAQFGPGAANP